MADANNASKRKDIKVSYEPARKFEQFPVTLLGLAQTNRNDPLTTQILQQLLPHPIRTDLG